MVPTSGRMGLTSRSDGSHVRSDDSHVRSDGSHVRSGGCWVRSESPSNTPVGPAFGRRAHIDAPAARASWPHAAQPAVEKSKPDWAFPSEGPCCCTDCQPRCLDAVPRRSANPEPEVWDGGYGFRHRILHEKPAGIPGAVERPDPGGARVRLTITGEGQRTAWPADGAVEPTSSPRTTICVSVSHPHEVLDRHSTNSLGIESYEHDLGP